MSAPSNAFARFSPIPFTDSIGCDKDDITAGVSEDSENVTEAIKRAG
jgi:hypothetical protein